MIEQLIIHYKEEERKIDLLKEQIIKEIGFENDFEQIFENGHGRWQNYEVLEQKIIDGVKYSIEFADNAYHEGHYVLFIEKEEPQCSNPKQKTSD